VSEKKVLKSVNIWQSYKREGDCLVRLANTLLEDGESELRSASDRLLDWRLHGWLSVGRSHSSQRPAAARVWSRPVVCDSVCGRRSIHAAAAMHNHLRTGARNHPRALQIRTNSVITPHHSIFTGRTLFLTPYQQCQSTEGKLAVNRGWRGSRVVSVLDSGAEGPGFKSQSRRCRVVTRQRLRQTVHTHRASVELSPTERVDPVTGRVHWSRAAAY